MIEIIHLDDHIIVCRKPAGLLSEGDGPDSLCTLLARQSGGTVFPVHRLDRGAAGLMVFARSSRAAAALSRAVQQKQLKKEYLALVSGVPAQPQGELADFLFKDGRKGKVFAVSRSRKGVREARLTYRVLWQREGEDPAALVHVALDTGRTHQIRVQFSSRGMPLWGDGKYGSRVKGPLALFSCTLGFPHPATGQPMEFRASPTGAPWEGVEGLPLQWAGKSSGQAGRP